MVSYRKKRGPARKKRRVSKRVSYRKKNIRGRRRYGRKRSLRGRNSLYGTSGVRSLVIRHPEGQIKISSGSLHAYSANLVDYAAAYGKDTTYSHQILAQAANHWKEFRIKKRLIKFWLGHTHTQEDTQIMSMYTLYDSEAQGRFTTVESMLAQPKCRIKFVKPGKIYSSSIAPRFSDRDYGVNTGAKGAPTQFLAYPKKNLWLPVQYLDGLNGEDEVIKSVNTEHIMFTIPTPNTVDDIPICYREEIYYEFRQPLSWPMNYLKP